MSSGPQDQQPHTVLYLISTLVGLADLDLLIDQAARDAGVDPDVLTGLERTITILGTVFGLLWAALFLVMLWFAWRGHNWARVVLWVLGGLGLLSVVGGLGNPVPFLDVVTVLMWLLAAAGIVLLALAPSNEWYRAETRRRRPWGG